jgi:uncharacterized membrane protein
LKPWETIRVRLGISLAAGAAAAALGSAVGPAEGVLIGIAVAGVIFVAFGWKVLWRLTQPETEAAYAKYQDLNHGADEAIVVGIALASLGGIAAFILVGPSSDTWSAAVAVVGMASAWASLHLMYAARYAHVYYDERRQGRDKAIDFNADELPSYRDFLYFSYNLGMTYQVSDTNVTSSVIRHVVLRHCLLSYVFGTAILATTINLVLGALTG